MLDTAPVIIPGNANLSELHRNAELLRNRFSIVPTKKIKEALSKYLSDDSWQLIPIHDGFGSIVYFAKKSNGLSVVVKIGIFKDTHSPHEDFIYTSLLNCYFESSYLAKPILLDLSGMIIPYPFYVMHVLPGKSLLSLYEHGKGPEPLYALSQVAQVLGLLHSAKMEVSGFGPLIPSIIQQISQNHKPQFLIGKWNDANDYFSSGFKRNIEREEVKTFLNFNELEVLRQIAYNGVPRSLTPGCIHGDPSLRNFIFDKQVIKGVIDGSGRLGWIEEDVAGCCVFIWQHSFRLNTNKPWLLISSFLNEYIRISGRSLEYSTLKSLILRKAISRIYTSLKLGDKKGVSSMISLIRETIENKVNTIYNVDWK